MVHERNGHRKSKKNNVSSALTFKLSSLTNRKNAELKPFVFNSHRSLLPSSSPYPFLASRFASTNHPSLASESRKVFLLLFLFLNMISNTNSYICFSGLDFVDYSGTLLWMFLWVVIRILDPIFNAIHLWSICIGLFILLF